MPAVSLIIPVFNVRPYVDRCIISVLEQTFSDFEAIFIDDRGTDGSFSAVERFARNDRRITCLRHPRNRGLAAARNSGVARARADYITFLDSDDFISPNLLETMVAATEEGRFDVVETGCEAIDERDKALWRYEPQAMQIDCKPDSILSIQEWGVTQKLWRKSLFGADIRFPEGAYWEDIAVVPRLIASARNLNKVPFVGYSYLQRTDSISNSASVKHILDMFKAVEAYRLYLAQAGISAAYRETFIKVATGGAEYQAGQIAPRGRVATARARALTEICRALLADYLDNPAVLAATTEPQLAAAADWLLAMAPADAEPGLPALRSWLAAARQDKFAKETELARK